MRLRVASRKSDLARWQAVQVARALERHASRPSIEFIFKASLGDLNQDVPLDAMGSKGVFTEDFYEDLKSGQCDIVVHSWKDLPIEPRAETQIVMTMPRADVRDLLLIPEDVWQQTVRTGTLKILTSSPRRVYNLAPILPAMLPTDVTVEFAPIRGNVPTRLARMHEMKAGMILAKAGLDRLLQAESEGFLKNEVPIRAQINKCRFMVLPISVNPPAPAQGALAVEVACTNEQVLSLCKSLSNEATFKAAGQEREILHKYGGGCHQKIGVAVQTRAFGLITSLRGQTDAGEILNEWKIANRTPWSPAAHVENIFPLKPADNQWFERTAVKADPSALAEPGALMVARADAWPRGYAAPMSQIVWTAGVKSWTKLAAAGVWVHGCTDGLGEDEDPNLNFMCDSLSWCKLTHSRAAGAQDIITYELTAREEYPDLNGKTHFFWMSGTSFDRAVKLFPRIVSDGFHACGPGSTFKHLQGISGLKHPVKVFIGLEQFLAETLP